MCVCVRAHLVGVLVLARLRLDIGRALLQVADKALALRRRPLVRPSVLFRLLLELGDLLLPLFDLLVELVEVVEHLEEEIAHGEGERRAAKGSMHGGRLGRLGRSGEIWGGGAP